MLLLPDEVLRFPLDEALVIIRGQKVLKVKKFDYSKHPEAKKFALEKTENHMPEWRLKQEEVGKKEEDKHPTVMEEPEPENKKIEKVEDLFTDEW